MRWAGIFRDLGHQVTVAIEDAGQPADLMVALHAFRSAGSIERFRGRCPKAPIIVALTGTDIYRFIDSDPEPTLRALDAADALVGLHSLVGDAIPERYRHKLSVIFQSAPKLGRPLPPLARCFEIVVVGHLRAEKDPLRAAFAARLLPPSSRIRIVQYGGAHSADWAASARAEMSGNARYHWRGDVPGGLLRRRLSRARLMVLSSIMEGGANVISEAIVLGVPVIASAIAGSIGLLGEDYAGIYPVGDSAALASQMSRAEMEPDFLRDLQRACATRAPLFDPVREREAWQLLIERTVGPNDRRRRGPKRLAHLPDLS